MSSTRLIPLLALLSLALGGCMTQEIEYVDEQGNVLAQDANGQPILPGRMVQAAPAPARDMPVDPFDRNVKVGDTFIVDSKPVPAKRVVKSVRSAPKTVRPQPTPVLDDPLGVPPTGTAPAASGTPWPRTGTPTRAPKRQPAVAPAGPIDSSDELGAPPTR